MKKIFSITLFVLASCTVDSAPSKPNPTQSLKETIFTLQQAGYNDKAISEVISKIFFEFPHKKSTHQVGDQSENKDTSDGDQSVDKSRDLEKYLEEFGYSPEQISHMTNSKDLSFSSEKTYPSWMISTLLFAAGIGTGAWLTSASAAASWSSSFLSCALGIYVAKRYFDLEQERLSVQLQCSIQKSASNQENEEDENSEDSEDGDSA